MIAAVGFSSPNWLAPGPVQFPSFARGLYATADMLAGPAMGSGMAMPEFSCGMMMPPMLEQQMLMMCMLQASMLGMMSSLLMQQAMAGTNCGCLPLYRMPPGEMGPPQPTQVPVPDEWSAAAADALHVAMARPGTDRESVFRMLEEATPAQLRALNSAFEDRHGEYWYEQGGHLRGALRSELNDADFDRAVVALMRMHEPDSSGAPGYWEPEQRVETGSGKDTVTQAAGILSGNVTQEANSGAGDDDVDQVASPIVGDVAQTVEAGPGADQIDQSATPGWGDVTQTVAAGDGDDAVTQVATPVVGEVAQTVDAGNGADTVEQVAAPVFGDVTQTTEAGAGDDAVTQVATPVVGEVAQTVDAGNGADTVEQVAAPVFGDVTQTTEAGAGDDAVIQEARPVVGDVAQTVEAGPGADTVTQVATPVVGEVIQAVTAGEGADVVVQEAAPVLAPVTQTVEAGPGDDTVTQVATPVVGEVIQAVTAGEGDDVVTQTAAPVLAPVTQTAVEAEVVTQTATPIAGDVTQTVIAAETAQQTAAPVAGDVTQTAEAVVVTQTATPVLGETVQTATGGETAQTVTGLGSDQQTATATDNVSQTSQTLGPTVQTAQTGGDATQSAGTFGDATQTVTGNENANRLSQQGPTFGRSDQTSVAGANDDVVVQRAGQGILGFFTDGGNMRTDLGAGNDTLTVEGNSSDDAIRVDTGSSAATGPDRDTVTVNAGRGDDTVMVRLSRDADRYTIDGGRGTDRLVVHEGQNRTRIVDARGRVLYQSEGWTEADSVITASNMEQATIYRSDGSYASWTPDGGVQIRRDPPTTASMTPVQAARVFRDNMDFMDNAAGVGNRDGIVGKPDLTAMLNNPNTPPELRTAIQYTLDNPAVWRSLDAAGARSDRFDLGALNSYIDQFERSPGFTNAPLNDRQATEVLRHYFPVLGPSGVFSENDLRVFLRENQGAPPELRQAADYLLSHQALQDRLDNASGMLNWIRDDRYSTADLDKYLNR